MYFSLKFSLLCLPLLLSLFFPLAAFAGDGRNPMAALPNGVSTRGEAVVRALKDNKLILLVAGKSFCANCELLEDYTLVSKDPPIEALLNEAYVYWYSDLDYSDNDVHRYVADMGGGFDLPLVCQIDPLDPTTCKTRYLGYVDTQLFWQSLKEVALAAETPQLTNLRNGSSINAADFVVNGAMKWSKMPISSVWYQANSGAWVSAPASVDDSGQQIFSAPLEKVDLVKGSNTLNLYVKDDAGHRSKTLTVRFNLQ